MVGRALRRAFIKRARGDGGPTRTLHLNVVSRALRLQEFNPPRLELDLLSGVVL